MTKLIEGTVILGVIGAMLISFIFLAVNNKPMQEGIKTIVMEQYGRK